MNDYYDEEYELELEKYNFIEFIVDKIKNEDTEENFLFNQSLLLLEQNYINENDEKYDSGYDST